MQKLPQYTFIDLFCGCGGFTRGMERAGLECLAAVDFNAEAVYRLLRNALRPLVGTAALGRMALN